MMILRIKMYYARLFYLMALSNSFQMFDQFPNGSKNSRANFPRITNVMVKKFTGECRSDYRLFFPPHRTASIFSPQPDKMTSKSV